MMEAECRRLPTEPLQRRAAAPNVPGPTPTPPRPILDTKMSFIAGPQRVFSGQVVYEYPRKTCLARCW